MKKALSFLGLAMSLCLLASQEGNETQIIILFNEDEH